jgi:hypothetical protein
VERQLTGRWVSAGMGKDTISHLIREGMYMNRNCPDFEATRYVCDYFVPNGSCKRPTRFMCHIFIDTDKQPVQDDVPLHLGKVLETFNGSTVIKETGKKPRLEDIFGKV